MHQDMDAFLARMEAMPAGYREGRYGNRRYGVTASASADGRRRWLFAAELGGPDRVSCNLYRLADGRAALRPCEMTAEKVIAFVLGFEASP